MKVPNGEKQRVESGGSNSLLYETKAAIPENDSISSKHPDPGKEMISAKEVDQIWVWNGTVPATINRHVDKMIEQMAQALPDKLAVCAWDGDLKYSELNQLAAQLAGRLVTMGIQQGMVVPICFEKSKWMTVAILSVLKAGGAFVLLDPSLPEQRLDTIIKQVGADLIIAGVATESICSRLASTMVVIDDNLINSSKTTMNLQTSSEIDASQRLMYVTFTSGSTGTPKGVSISHSNFCSAFEHQSQLLSLDKDARVFEFASYAFDISILNNLATLMAGGCLCVPSENQRKGNISKVMACMRVTLAVLTPTVARLLDPSGLPELKRLILIGEPVHKEDFQKWWGKITITNAYGPSECPLASTINCDAQSLDDAVCIGKGSGLVTWVVDPSDCNLLLPLGRIGELLLEGPAVGLGYFNQPEQTATVFIDSPPWLQASSRIQPGRRSRLYKTGDLVRYRSDGKLQFVGRKDTQVKIRGQRVELGEVEYKVRRNLDDMEQVIAEVINPGGKEGHPRLVAFVVPREECRLASIEVPGAPGLRVLNISEETERRLAQELPTYMIPTAFLTIDHLPLTASGKIYRKGLRDLGASLSAQSLAGIQTAGHGLKRAPSSATESIMREIWARELGLSPSEIGLDDSFFQLGGDSVSAIKVAQKAETLGLRVSVADIFRQRSLVRLASEACMQSSSTSAEVVAPWSLIQGSHNPDTLVHLFSSSNQIEEAAFEDLYPCTPLQEGLISLSLQYPGDYIWHGILDLSPDIDLQTFEMAWERVVQSTSILRTRFFEHHSIGLVQAVINKPIPWLKTASLDGYLEADKRQPMHLGTEFTRFAIIEDDAGKPKQFVWTLHHALFDGWSLPLIIEEVYSTYKGIPATLKPQFRSFIKHTTTQNRDKMEEYWRRTLKGLESVPFPALPPSIRQPAADSLVQVELPLLRPSSADITASTLIRAAWALVAREITMADDVVFGVVVSGRNALVPGITEIAGPTIATVPFRVKVDMQQSVSSYLRLVDQLTIDMIPYEQTGLQYISKASSDAKHACKFQTVLVVQPKKQQNLPDTGLGSWHEELEWFNSYSLMLEAILDSASVSVKANFDSRVIQPWLVRKLLALLDRTMQQLASKLPEEPLLDINMMSSQDLEKIWTWNAEVPETIDDFVDEAIGRVVQSQPSTPAICAWDGHLTYSELDKLSTQLADRLVNAGVEDGKIVPLCFEKSMWTPVAMLSVLKAGGAFVMLDDSLPELRLKTIVDNVKAPFILSSTRNGELSSRLSECIIQIGGDSIRENSPVCQEPAPRLLARRSSPLSAIMFIVFSSGSTGVPKGTLMTHSNFSSGVKHQAALLGFSQGSRVYDFASYGFDAAVHNAFATFMTGGCLCIPSDSDRRNHLINSMSSMRTTLVDLTPTVARLLDPAALPSLETLILAGEASSARDVRPWIGKSNVINAYGPSECTVHSTVNPHASTTRGAMHIGKGAGLVTWVVDPHNHDRLVPPGCPGELVLEGPLVGIGYLHEPQKTEAAFIKDPAWLLKGTRNCSGRRGRIYKTGDLVQYNEDGTLVFLGRKDMQVKIRGQRIELGEVEHCIRNSMPDTGLVAAEMIYPQDGDAVPVLAAFIEPSELSPSPTPGIVEIIRAPTDVERNLSIHLPIYMIPSVLFAMDKLPLTATGKINRRRLREIGGSFSVEQLAEARTTQPHTKRKPVTQVEHQLQQIWAQVLGIEPLMIGLDDSFVQLGGDSIAAIKVVSGSRNVGLELSVADILDDSIFQTVAGRVRTQVKKTEDIAPFSLLGPDSNISQLLSQISSQYQLDQSLIQDIVPCTPLQEGLILSTLKEPKNYVTQNVMRLRDDIDLPTFINSWEEVVRCTPILRTQIVLHDDYGLLQVVSQMGISWSESVGLETYLEADKAESMALGRPLVRYALVKRNKPGGERWFVWTLHHAVYDGWTISLIMNAVQHVYRGHAMKPSPQFQSFLKYIGDHKEDRDTAEYWRKTFADCEAVPFPTLPASVRTPRTNSYLERVLPFPREQGLGVTVSSFIRASWALVTSQMTNSQDVVFGVTITGRNAPVAGINDIIGPTIATVPVRIQLQRDLTVKEFLQSIQKQATEMIPFEQTGLQHISRLSPACQQGCSFQTLLVVQPPAKETWHTLGTWQDSGDTHQSNMYAVKLELDLQTEQITARASFDSNIVESWMVNGLLEQLGHTLQYLGQVDPSRRLDQLCLMTAQDLDRIWEWNKDVPEPVERCVHDIISDRVRTQPEAIAVSAWDGEITYDELERLATALANSLLGYGLAPGDIVPLCFEKSMWTPVAVLAVAKAGGAFVLLDASLPQQRLKAITDQTRSNLILCSVANFILSSSLSDHARVVPVGVELKNHIHRACPGAPLASPTISPDSTMAVVFTSGSTGIPKGVLLTHRNFCSSLKYHPHLLGFKRTSRVFDFASYSFDAAIRNILTTLATGGCICVPSDAARKGDISAAMAAMQVTIAGLTPTVARLLQPTSIPSLKTLYLAGEPLATQDVLQWWGRVHVVQAYGPAEGTITSTINHDASTQEDVKNIGRGAGHVTWIVDPENHHRLMPVGAVGELLLEGPLVGHGYLNDADKTAAAFVSSPSWLQKRALGTSSRFKTLYKTGDLVKYNQDGTLMFIGRKDTQIKIRGQRVELGEVEHRLLHAMPNAAQVVVELIKPQEESGRPRLAAFVQWAKQENDDDVAIQKVDSTQVLGVPPPVMDTLSEHLPLYMIPTILIALPILPISPTGKMNRKALQEIGSSFSMQQLANAQTSGQEMKRLPETEVEKTLRDIWARVLSIEPISISLNHGFIQLGGDSLSTMKVVSMARRAGLEISAEDVLLSRSLAQLSRCAAGVNEDIQEPIAAFSLLANCTDLPSVIADVSSHCNIDRVTVQDIFPCTPLQEGLLSLTMKRPGDYTMQATLELSPHLSVSTFRRAWEEVVRRLPILRTRIVNHDTMGLLQVILDTNISWIETTDLQGYCETDRQKVMEMGQPFTRYALVLDTSGTTRWFVWTIHHALYDGWSMALIMDAVERAYQGHPIEDGPQFQAFIKNSQTSSEETTAVFWRTYLTDSDASPFPALSVDVRQPKADTSTEHCVPLPQNQHAGITLSTLIRAAWALVSGGMTSSNDLVFGVTSFGRHVAIPRIEDMAAPTIATVPVRVRFRGDQRVADFLDTVQHEGARMIPFEQTGLQHIAKLSPSCQQSCMFQTLLVIQPKRQKYANTEALGNWTYSDQDQYFNTYGLSLEISTLSDKIEIKASFDSRLISLWTVQNLLIRLGSVMHQLDSAHADNTVADINSLTDHDLDQIWSWNRQIPKSIDRCIHNLVSERATAQPTATAVYAWDGELTYAELEQMTTNLAYKLIQLGLQPESIVPLCFEKSMWTIVAMLAVLKAGGAFLMIDVSLPEQRLRNMIEQTSSTIILSSISAQELSAQLSRSAQVILVGPDTLEMLAGLSPAHLPIQQAVTSTSTMAIIFTSGSTGASKGVLLSHGNFCSSIYYHAHLLGFKKDYRVFDFASYAFDAAIRNALTTLAVGGCICVPSEEQRRGDLSRVMAAMRANVVDLTPTVARLLNPIELPHLKTLILAGEAVSIEDATPWWGRLRVINAYGPAEGSIISTINHDALVLEDITHIGKGAGHVTWIVDPDDHEKLLPPGCTGELLLEGPLVTKGYLKNPKKTAISYIKNPSWLLKGTPEHPGRSGTLYKTGDLVRYNENGTLTFMGRKDTQVKIRGQRVELGEIEYRLQHCMADAGHVVVEPITPRCEDNSRVSTMLAIFSSSPETSPDATNTSGELAIVPISPSVESKLAEHLPQYMIPVVQFILSELPLTVTGKVDRKQLRQMGASMSLQEILEIQATRSKPKRRPTSPIETLLQKIWSQVLTIDPLSIGLDDNFFQLGGDSIGAMRVVSGVRKLGREMTVAQVFQHPRLVDMSHVLSAATVGPQTIPSVEISGPIEQSFAQQRLWFLEKLHPGLSSYMIPCAVRLRGPLHLEALETAISTLERRHEALRTTFSTLNGINTQTVHPYQPRQLRVVHLIGAGDKDIEQALTNDETTLFNLETVPGWRVSIYRLGESDHLLSIVMHHIISDGWSMDVIRRELSAFYSAALCARDPLSVVRPLPIRYRDYSIWQKQKAGENGYRDQLDYWVNHLESSQPAVFFCDYPRPDFLSGKGAVQEFRIDSLLYEDLRLFCQSRGVTVFTTLLAAFRAAHFRLTGAHDATIGTINASRDRWELENVIGVFVNMQCLRIRMEDESFDQLVQHVHDVAVSSFANQDVPFEQIVSKLRKDRASSSLPLAQVAFALHARQELDHFELEGLESEPIGFSTRCRFDLEFHLFPDKDGLQGQLVYSTDLFCADTIRNIISVFQTVLEKSLTCPSLEINLQPLLTNAAEAALCNMGLLEIEKRDYPRNASIVDVFRQQVSSTPEHLAVKDSSYELTYSQLDQQSDLIARWLCKKSFSAEAIIGVIAHRSCYTVIAFLAILKADLAYLPLDPSTPRERIHAILLTTPDLQMILLGTGAEPSSLPAYYDQFFSISNVLQNECGTQLSDDQGVGINLPSPRPNTLAYVVFTSGSTGRPKGVLVEHRGIVRMVKGSNVTDPLPQNPIMAHTISISFDAAQWEIYATLLNGGTLICLDNMDLLDQQAFARIVIDDKIQVASFTPALLRRYLKESPEAISSLHTIYVGGDKAYVEDLLSLRSIIKGAILNVYGPTENSVTSTMYKLTETDMCTNGVAIGRAISNSGAFVLDHQSCLVPLGVVGELVVTGDGLARGYVDPSQNSDKFITIMVGGKETRAYRTGDYVRYRPVDGQLEFLGRMDGQVKIRGYRIELGEIEHVLQSHEAVIDAVAVIHRQIDQELSIACFITVSRDDGDLSSAEKSKLQKDLYQKLRMQLPSYMVPQTITAVDAMPLTINGKVNRRALAERAPTIQAEEAVKRQPTSFMERHMQKIWAEVLNIVSQDIGLDDSFFRLGGNSITAMKLVAEARKAGIRFAIADVFRYNTLGELASRQTSTTVQSDEELDSVTLVSPDEKAKLLKAIDSLKIKLTSNEVLDILPITSFQERALGSRQRCYYFQLDLGRTVNLEHLEMSWISTLKAFPILRAQFLSLFDRYWQVVPYQAKLSIAVHETTSDLDLFCHKFWLDDLKGLSATEPPFGITLFSHAIKGYRMMVRLSHAQYDGISLPIVLQFFADTYSGNKVSTPKTDFSRFLSHSLLKRPESIRYWTKVLKGSSPIRFSPTLDLDRICSSSAPRRVEVQANLELPDLPGNLTVVPLVSAAWGIILSRITGANDVVFGHVVAGRNSGIDGIEEIVGPCLNIIPIRSLVSPNQSSGDLLHYIHNQLMDVGEADSLGYREIAEFCTDWAVGDDFEFESTVQHQNINEHPAIRVGHATPQVSFSRDQDLVPPSHIDLISYPEGNNLHCELISNSSCITLEAATKMLVALGQAMVQLAARTDTSLTSILNDTKMHLN